MCVNSKVHIRPALVRHAVILVAGALGWSLSIWSCSDCLSFLQAAEEVSKHLQAIKGMLYGSAEQEPQPDVVATLAHELYSSDVLVHLVDNLQKLDFEVGSTLIMFIMYVCCPKDVIY